MAEKPCPICGGPVRAEINRHKTYCSRDCYFESMQAAGPRPADPTLEEIAERCLLIQATWDDEQRIDRMDVSQRPVAWVVPGATVGN